MGFWILVILFVLLLLSVPTWPHSVDWGYFPAGVVFALLVIWLILLWIGWVAFAWPVVW